MPGQLILPFEVRSALGREDFIVAPCNESGFRFIERWPRWPARAAALFGPTGCGKTHLARVWMGIASAVEIPLGLLAAERWNGPSTNLVPYVEEQLVGLAPDQAVLVEDIDGPGGFMPIEERDRLLMTLFERASGTLLLTGTKPPALWPVALGDLKSRFEALLAFPMWEPDETLLSRLVRKLFADRQLDVPDAVVKRILSEVERLPASVARFVARADEKALAEKRSVSERLVLELLDEDWRNASG